MDIEMNDKGVSPVRGEIGIKVFENDAKNISCAVSGSIKPDELVSAAIALLEIARQINRDQGMSDSPVLNSLRDYLSESDREKSELSQMSEELFAEEIKRLLQPCSYDSQIISFSEHYGADSPEYMIYKKAIDDNPDSPRITMSFDYEFNPKNEDFQKIIVHVVILSYNPEKRIGQ